MPLRHLWSLAVEEQFYLIWPLVMVGILRLGRHRLPRVALWLFGISAWISLIVGLSVRQRRCRHDVRGQCDERVLDALRPMHQRQRGVVSRHIQPRRWIDVGRGVRDGVAADGVDAWPAREKARYLDLLGLLGLAALGLLIVGADVVGRGRSTGIRFNPWLFRGGFFLTGRGDTDGHRCRHPSAGDLGRLLGNRRFSTGSARAATACICTTGRSTRSFEACRRGDDTQTMVDCNGHHSADDRGQLSVHRDADPAGPFRRMVARAIVAHEPQRRTNGVNGIAGVGIVSAALCRFRRRQHRNGPQPVCRPDRVRSRQRRPYQSTRSHRPARSPVDTLLHRRTSGGTAGGSAKHATRRHLTRRRLPRPSPSINDRTYAIGESVMLGAKSQLEAKGFKVDAEESRQGKEVVNLLARLRAAGQLGRIVVIHIGTNGEVSDETFAAIMANLPPDEVTTVWFLKVGGDLSWTAGNNERIVALPCKYPNVWVGYWADLVPSIAGMSKDGIHLKTNEAKQQYADLIASWALTPQDKQCK